MTENFFPSLPPQVVMLCCSIKPLCGWNNEDCATTCRERCGGQGYLSCNRFGSILGFAHAGEGTAMSAARKCRRL